MKRAAATALAVLLTGCAGFGLPDMTSTQPTAPAGPPPLTGPEIAAGLRQALTTGTERAVARLGVTDGFWARPELQIPLPESMNKAAKALRALGQARLVEEFHLSLNRAAEAAVPEAAPIFANAIQGLTLADARQILQGPPTAATEYFRQHTSTALTARFKPLVTQATDRAGATRRYKEMVVQVARYVPNYKGEDLDGYVTERALNGLFRTLAVEEKRIRENPGARTSEILRRVFGGT